MVDTDKAALIRRGFEAFAQGDMATLQQLLSSDVVWHQTGDNSLTGDYKGQEVFKLFETIFEETGGSMRQEIHDITTSEEHAVAMVSTSATRKSRKMAMGQFFVFHFDGDKVSEVFVFGTDQKQADEFWA